MSPQDAAVATEILKTVLGAGGVPGVAFFGAGVWWMALKIKDQRAGNGTGKLTARIEAVGADLRAAIASASSEQLMAIQETSAEQVLAIKELEVAVIKAVYTRGTQP